MFIKLFISLQNINSENRKSCLNDRLVSSLISERPHQHPQHPVPSPIDMKVVIEHIFEIIVHNVSSVLYMISIREL